MGDSDSIEGAPIQDEKSYERRLAAYSKKFEDEGGDLHGTDPIGYALAVLSNGRTIAIARKLPNLVARFDLCIRKVEDYKATGHHKLDDYVIGILDSAFEGVDHRFEEAAHSPRFIA